MAPALSRAVMTRARLMRSRTRTPMAGACAVLRQTHRAARSLQTSVPSTYRVQVVQRVLRPEADVCANNRAQHSLYDKRESSD